ncbi:hypothetical protein SAMN05421810_11575 [Amycolatopsis arida]|uniref:Tetratrico peptide repeat-containing protein n=1 Tax=Amycolatopsis arida TaxID=587909 RepID=A0A1I6AXK1_9PSEU|nr:hypothetical protein [Amycolatopsis arida]TDX85343.1 hypothetical protein CLV69_1152 [Amycolatopsis arida]SFQ73448.1 hypothetical protein SAMN05421810_11575 [Amycolatopsis arida]
MTERDWSARAARDSDSVDEAGATAAPATPAGEATEQPTTDRAGVTDHGRLPHVARPADTQTASVEETPTRPLTTEGGPADELGPATPDHPAPIGPGRRPEQPEAEAPTDRDEAGAPADRPTGTAPAGEPGDVPERDEPRTVPTAAPDTAPTRDATPTEAARRDEDTAPTDADTRTEAPSPAAETATPGEDVARSEATASAADNTRAERSLSGGEPAEVAAASGDAARSGAPSPAGDTRAGDTTPPGEVAPAAETAAPGDDVAPSEAPASAAGAVRAGGSPSRGEPAGSDGPSGDVARREAAAPAGEPVRAEGTVPPDEVVPAEAAEPGDPARPEGAAPHGDAARAAETTADRTAWAGDDAAEEVTRPGDEDGPTVADGARGSAPVERRDGRPERRPRDRAGRRGQPTGDTADGAPPTEPELPEGIEYTDLDEEVRRELRGLPKDLAERVGRHLVAAGQLIDEDPETALEHARYAKRRASRIPSVREAVGLTAYHAGQWAEALSELRAVRRMTHTDAHLAVIADAERALGRPERALDIARDADLARLPKDVQVELRIVAAGARRDLGQLDAAVVALQGPDLEPARRREPWAVRLFYAYADNLAAAGRIEEAVRWFLHAAEADEYEETDASERTGELSDDHGSDHETGRKNGHEERDHGDDQR